MLILLTKSSPVPFLKENCHYDLLCAPTIMLHHSSFLHRPLMSFSGNIAVTPSSQARTCRGLQLSKRTPSLLSHLLPSHFNKFKNSSLLPNSASSLKSIAHGLDLPYRNVFHFFFFPPHTGSKPAPNKPSTICFLHFIINSTLLTLSSSFFPLGLLLFSFSGSNKNIPNAHFCFYFLHLSEIPFLVNALWLLSHSFYTLWGYRSAFKKCALNVNN